MSIIIEGMDMPKCCGSCEFNNGYRCTRTETVIDRDYEYQERLSDCPLHEESKWVPITEKLPEEAGAYLVTISFGNNYHRIIMDFDGEKFVERLIPAFTKGIIAWMPLPEPYVEEGE